MVPEYIAFFRVTLVKCAHSWIEPTNEPSQTYFLRRQEVRCRTKTHLFQDSLGRGYICYLAAKDNCLAFQRIVNLAVDLQAHRQEAALEKMAQKGTHLKWGGNM